MIRWDVDTLKQTNLIGQSHSLCISSNCPTSIIDTKFQRIYIDPSDCELKQQTVERKMILAAAGWILCPKLTILANDRD